jgi:hypothetical protein
MNSRSPLALYLIYVELAIKLVFILSDILQTWNITINNNYNKNNSMALVR